MSTRSSIVYAGPIHIYEETNSYEPGGGYTVCISDLDGRRCSYNGDVVLDREVLVKIRKELGEYLAEKRPKGGSGE